MNKDYGVNQVVGPLQISSMVYCGFATVITARLMVTADHQGLWSIGPEYRRAVSRALYFLVKGFFFMEKDFIRKSRCIFLVLTINILLGLFF